MKTVYLSLFFIICSVTVSLAQTAQEVAAPRWVAKVQKSLVSILSYDAKNELLHRGTGICVDDAGTVICPYGLLKDAYSAQVVDMNGRQEKVTHVLGANDTYDVVKLEVKSLRTPSLRLGGSTTAVNGSRVYALPFSKQEITTCYSSTVQKKEIVEEKYAYYTLSSVLNATCDGAALLSENGQLLGMVQSAIGGHSYAIDAAYARNLTVDALQTKASALALSSIHLPKGIPDSREEALVYLFFQSHSADNTSYMDMLNQFISRWPNCAEGYYRRITPELDLLQFDEANKDLETYLNLAEDKMTAHANAAQTIHTKLHYQSDKPYEKWTYDLALSHNSEAQRLAQQQVAAAKTDSLRKVAQMKVLEYRLQEAQLLSAKGEDRAALAIYDEVNASPYRAPATYFAASMAHEAAGDSADVCLALMDSALALLPQPLTQEAASYVLRQGQLLATMGKYRAAVRAYNQYDTLLNHQMSAQFYYDRAMLEQEGRMFQLALNDLDLAIKMQPRQALYYVEKSALLLRVNMLDECIESAQQCIALSPKLYDAYRIMGYAQIQKGDKQTARKNLETAVSLGDTQAQELLDQFCKP